MSGPVVGMSESNERREGAREECREGESDGVCVLLALGSVVRMSGSRKTLQQTATHTATHNAHNTSVRACGGSARERRSKGQSEAESRIERERKEREREERETEERASALSCMCVCVCMCACVYAKSMDTRA